MINELKQFREKVNEIKAEKRILSAQLVEKEVEKSEAEIFGVDCVEARSILQVVAKSTQELLEKKFSSLVTLAIRTIFRDDREFVIQFVEKRNKTELECHISKDNNVVGIYDGGGGQIDVVALSCRLAFWSLQKTSRPIFFLDEPLAFLHSPEYQERASDLLQMLSKELKVQFLVVSDQSEIIGNRTFRVADGIVNVIE